ncbi:MULTISPECIES: ABC transporter permease [Micromonospora]|uniref:Transport permease protein n=1 Tax=Micromonospora yangpuensis TaxID=683228 RepID=A0A1C6UU65_9ACTN|nr:ABC transporter permease [Micromonospora yangpuensis]GGM24202.1 transport permease protein [Micromonospora yangpuensis]SCL57624.1 ABC-2 type transport system permease protein [Micromonospora yangpuensis]
MTAPALTAATGSRFLPATRVIARRSMLRYLRNPQTLFVSAVQGVAFMLIFRYAFGGAIDSGGLKYIDYLVPGVVTAGVLFSGGLSAVGVAEDAGGGFFDRFRSMPMPHSSILIGRVLADTALVAWATTAMVAVAFAVGFRVHTDVWSGVLAFGLVVLFGAAFVCVFTGLGMFAVGNPQAAQALGFLVLPLSFASSAFVPVQTMPGWLQAVAEYQPVTMVVNAARVLTQGQPAEALLDESAAFYVWSALLWSAAIILVFGTMALVRISRR